MLTHARKDAFVAEIEALNLKLEPEWIIPGDFSLAAGCLAAKTCLALDDRPTAVFCASDLLALGFISELSRHDLKVPEDVSVMGFDDIELAEQFIPPLTTIRQDRIRIGETAANMLLERLDVGSEVSEELSNIVPVSLIVRNSTAAPR